MSLKTPLGRVLGLGSARGGTDHWWSQRVTAIALIPLTLWFVFSLTLAPSFDYDTMAAWLARPVNAILMILVVAILLNHSRLGVQVVLEDYSDGATKVAGILLMQFAHVVLGVASVFAVLKISLGY